VDQLDAVVLAAGRLHAREAARAGHDLKGLVHIGEGTPLQAMLQALSLAPRVKSVIVVGPHAARASVSGFDRWVDEHDSVEENALAGLRAATTRRVLLCASDVPFIEAEHVQDFLVRVSPDADIAYPIYERDEFLAVYPDGRSKFARVGDCYWTGGSLCVLNCELALRSEQIVRRAFKARRSQVGMAQMLGLAILLRHLSGRLRIEHILERIGNLTGGKVVAIRGAHPALAMDCDSVVDVEYARLHMERSKPRA
jgi:molybdopterin-guanine dinucleotide biosynthesis protein A